jgi:dUTP pyrophosphatase
MQTHEHTETLQIHVVAKKAEYLPAYATSGASGADIRACIDAPIVIRAKSFQAIRTGLFFEIPQGYEVQIRPRSGLARKSGITVLNTPGTIDSDYRGEIQVILINHSDHDFTVTDGMRIAQMCVSQTVQANFCPVETLGKTSRGEGGFGHTGLN